MKHSTEIGLMHDEAERALAEKEIQYWERKQFNGVYIPLNPFVVSTERIYEHLHIENIERHANSEGQNVVRSFKKDDRFE